VRTEAAWRGDAFTVGDLGRLDEDGYLFLAGRRSDLIFSGGVNVYPAEVELALIEMPGVDDVVFPRTKRRWGQRVCAAIVGHVDVDGGALRRRAARAVQAAEGKVAAIAHFGLAKVRRDQMARDPGWNRRPNRLPPRGTATNLETLSVADSIGVAIRQTRPLEGEQ